MGDPSTGSRVLAAALLGAAAVCGSVLGASAVLGPRGALTGAETGGLMVVGASFALWLGKKLRSP